MDSMNDQRRRSTNWLAIILLATSPSASGADNNAAFDVISTDYQPYLDHMESYRCEIVISGTGDGKPFEPLRSAVEQHGGSALYYSYEGATKPLMVNGRNSNYFFVLARDQPDAPWQIANLFTKDAEQATTKPHRVVRLTSQNVLPKWAGMLAYQRNLFLALSEGQAEIVSADRPDANEAGDEEIMSVLIRRREGADPDWRFSKGTFQLNKRYHWQIVSAELEVEVDKDASQMKCLIDNSYEYQNELDAWTISKNSCEYMLSSANGETQSTIEIREYSFEPLEPDENHFRLTYFGLSEPIGMKQSGGSSLLWWATALAIVAVLAIGVFARRRLKG